MGQVLHGCATTTHAVRTAIQRSKAPLKELAARYGLNPRQSPSGVNEPSSTMPQWGKPQLQQSPQAQLVNSEAVSGSSQCRTNFLEP